MTMKIRLAMAMLLGGLILVFVGCEGAAQNAADNAAPGTAAPAHSGQRPLPPGALAASPAEGLALHSLNTPSGAGSIDPAAFIRNATPTGGMPALDEEVWVITKADADAAAHDEIPGTGSMLARDDATAEELPLPLRHTHVDASIAAYIASVDVTQSFENIYAETIEAIYVFPLPQNAAVNEFVMQIGERRIRGVIKPREEARETYERAKAAGHVASLLEQERPNIFTQHVANLAPGAAIDVNIRYFHTLAYDDGWYEYVFPMVVGPRFNPPGSTDGVGAVAYGDNGASGQSTEIAYLPSHLRSGHDISLQVTIEAGVPIDAVESVNHRVSTTQTSLDEQVVVLSDDDAIPNKDFVLRYRVIGDRLSAAMLTHRTEQGEGHFTLAIHPTHDDEWCPPTPHEMVFVMDVSGSMNGAPMRQSKDAVVHALRQLTPDDTFRIILFSNNVRTFSDRAVAATPDNVRKAVRYVKGLRANGGTYTEQGMRAALSGGRDAERPRTIAFLTDGYIGNEADILRRIHTDLGDHTRIFSFGVGTSTNRYLMNRMAKLGRGAVAYLSPNDDGGDVMDRFLRRVRRPAMTDLRIDFGELQVSDVYPERIDDLFVGRPVIVTGRFAGSGVHDVVVRGRINGQPAEIPLRVNVDEQAAGHEAIASVWARTRIAELADRSTFEPDSGLPRRIEQLALAHDLMSAYTSFVAVDSKTVVDAEGGVPVTVPVPMPEGVRLESAVGR